jgi:hypothetical protein
MAAVLAATVVQLLPLSAEYSIFRFATPFCDQTMVWEVPAVQVSPPFGATTVTLGGAEIAKALLLASLVEAFDASLTRTKPCEVGEFGTVQAYDPLDAGVLATSVVQLLPKFVEYSTITFDTPFCVQVILCEEVPTQFSPPFGETTVTLATDEIVNTPLLTSLTREFDASLTRTRACVEGEAGVVQA